MTGSSSALLGLGASLAFFVGGFGIIVFTTQVTLDLIRSRQVPPEEPNKYNYWKLLRIHRSIFPASIKRKLLWTSSAIFVTAWLVQLIKTVLEWHLNRLPK